MTPYFLTKSSSLAIQWRRVDAFSSSFPRCFHVTPSIKTHSSPFKTSHQIVGLLHSTPRTRSLEVMESVSERDSFSERENSSFRHFSEQLRLEDSAFSSLSISDSIWSEPFVSDDVGRRSGSFLSSAAPEFTPGDWSFGVGAQKLAFANFSTNRIKNNDEYNSKAGSKDGGFSNKNVVSSNGNGLLKNYYFEKSFGKPSSGNKNGSGTEVTGRKKNGNINKNSNDKNGNANGAAVDKRFKTLPASEALPRSEAVGGYIFVCNNDTMQENLERQLFGLPSRYRDSVRAITPGLPLFLYNYSTHQLYGIFEAASFGGTNIDPSAWQDKKKPGESRFPAQVRVVTRKLYYPLEEDSFRPYLHHYDGPKFRLELSIPEALALLDIFEAKNV